MKRNFMLGLFLLSLILPNASMALSPFVGVYNDSINSLANPGKIVIYETGSSLKAIYFMTTTVELEQGRISFDDLPSAPDTLEGTWTDIYGTGRVSFKFDPNFKSFEGTWGMGAYSTGGTWKAIRD